MTGNRPETAGRWRLAPDRYCTGEAGKAVAYFIGDIIGNVKTLWRGTGLTVIDERAPEQALGHLLGVDVRKHDACVVTTELQCQTLQRRRGIRTRQTRSRSRPSRARLWRDQGKRDEVAIFSLGFDALDLKEAFPGLRGIGLIVGSQRNVSCVFRGVPGEPDEPYTGTMTRVGLDVGVTTGSVIIWTVFANTNRYKKMLTGTYTGASAEMSIAAGLGANVLVGGSNHTLALQSLSLQGQVGLDIAAGDGSLDLHPSW